MFQFKNIDACPNGVTNWKNKYESITCQSGKKKRETNVGKYQ